MAKVTIHLAPVDVLGNLFLSDESIKIVRREFHRYTEAGTFETELKGSSAADEAFDLTNNPDRQEEREQKYGLGRSVSSGDVIDVDGKKWICASIGWRKF